MRRVMLIFALTLCASRAEAGILFTPDFFTLEVRGVFSDTNTDTFCWQCGDAIPSNDLEAVLENAAPLTESWTDFLPYTIGRMRLESTATNYLDLDAPFAFQVKLTAAGASLPESLIRPSVSFGILPGRLIGIDDGELLVLECCNGTVGGVRFQQAFFPSEPFRIPPEGLSRPLNLEVFFPNQIEYSPVPEPASMLLLGSALAAAALRHRIRKTRSS